MKWAEMLTCEASTLREHYFGVRRLAYNNANMAQSTTPLGTTRRKLANQMEYLMAQISMCENAAKKRSISLV